MAENTKKPAIRFAGFTEAWEQRKLGEVLIQRVEHQTISSDAPLLAFSYAEGVINPEDKKSNKRDFIMTDKFSKIFSRTELDDIIYNPANVIHGAIHRNKLGTGVVSPIYKIFICNNMSPKYMGERLHTDTFIKEITKYIEGTVIKLRTLSPEMFLEMSVEIPASYEEQEKIGVFFEQLDNLITLHQRKYDKLTNIKKSMLEKMFPKNGNNVPEIRFKGFTEAWEQRKLDTITDVRDGTHNSPQYVESGHPFITSKNVKDGFINYEDIQYVSDKDYEEINKRSKVDKNDILMGMIGTIGNIALVREMPDFAIKNVALIKDIGDVFYRYLYHCLQSNSVAQQLDENLDGGTQKFIALNKIRELVISIPSEHEQYKIGDYMELLDHLITLHQRKLEKLKNLKKACLEKMFV